MNAGGEFSFIKKHAMWWGIQWDEMLSSAQEAVTPLSLPGTGRLPWEEEAPALQSSSCNCLSGRGMRAPQKDFCKFSLTADEEDTMFYSWQRFTTPFIVQRSLTIGFNLLEFELYHKGLWTDHCNGCANLVYWTNVERRRTWRKLNACKSQTSWYV